MPPKKDPSTRARRNQASTASVLTAPRARRHVPDLPDVREWQDLTKRWWADLWSSPMSNEYLDSDRHALFMLAALMDDFWTTDTPGRRKVLSEEIRLSRQAFGLTPYDRRRLEWTIESAEESKDRGRQRRSRTGTAQPKTSADPRTALHAV